MSNVRRIEPDEIPEEPEVDRLSLALEALGRALDEIAKADEQIATERARRLRQSLRERRG